MRKLISVILCFILLLAACGKSGESKNTDNDSDSREYVTSDGSKVDIPKHPKRVLDLTANYGNFKKLGVAPIAITNVFPNSKYLKMDKVKKINPEDVEAAAKLKPDLIITYKENKNNKKLAKIAPTVPIKVQNMDYKETHIELGKLVNKEKLAQQQANTLAKKLAKDGKQIKERIGKDKTFSIMDAQAKDIYQFGPRFGRGSEAIYEGFGLAQDSDAEAALPKEQYMKVPKEKFNDYAGDYLLIPTTDGKKPNNEFVKSSIWKNNKAVQNNHVIYYTMDEAIYADLISVEQQAKNFKQQLLK